MKAIIFDAGKVLINFSFSTFREFLISRGISFSNEADFICKTRMNDYEIGEITSVDFLQHVQSLITAKSNTEEIAHKWTNIFSPIPEMTEFARSLKEQVPIYILSNTNELHWDHLIQGYDIEALCHQAFVSYKIGKSKPDISIYQYVEEQINIKPENILFIDDKIENIDGATQCNWNTIHHTDIQITKDRVLEFLRR